VLLLLIGLKIVADARAHLKERTGAPSMAARKS